MQVNVFCYGKYDTVKIFYDMKKAKTYLNRKKKEGFTHLKDVNGNNSEHTLEIWDGRINVWIQNNN